ncbi:MAG: F0F1 ATP synthase subunit B [Candidatus Competibacterales bacterium]
MNFNATLIGQMITFLLLVMFTMRYIWPPITQAMRERQQRIADGLAAAERSTASERDAKAEAERTIREARQQASEILARAQKQADATVEASRQQAREEGEKQLQQAQAEIEREYQRAREHLRDQVAQLAVAGASRILQREVDENAHRQLLEELATQL